MQAKLQSPQTQSAMTSQLHTYKFSQNTSKQGICHIQINKTTGSKAKQNRNLKLDRFNLKANTAMNQYNTSNSNKFDSQNLYSTTFAFEGNGRSNNSNGQDSYDPPSTSKEAIQIGLQQYDQGSYEQALDIFNQALTLPGSGVKRYRDKPPGLSEGEKQSAYYNIACCYSRLQKNQEGLQALQECLQTGYNDVKWLRQDPDLQNLQMDEGFEVLMSRISQKEQKSNEGFMSKIMSFFK